MNVKLNKSDLNFRVYSSPENPATGNENDILIISETPMINWRLSPDAPSGIPRTDGDVWIQYSVTNTTLDILKNNSMMIATIQAYQYVSGAWVDKTAKSYHGGVWVDWITFLYQSGNEYTDLTGGWVVKEKIGNAINGDLPTLTKEVSRLKVSLPKPYVNGVVRCNNTIDVTNFRQMSVTFSGSKAGYMRLYVYDSLTPGEAYDPKDLSAIAKVIDFTTPTVIDISEVTGKKYIGIGCAIPASDTAATFYIDEVALS